MLLLIALMTTIIERINPPLKVLAIDNVEALDGNNLSRILNGLAAAGQNMDNIILSGVLDMSLFDDLSGELPWRIWDLDRQDLN